MCPRVTDKKCVSNFDCDQNYGGECRTSDGVCLEEQWCAGNEPETYTLNPENYYIWFRSSVKFPDLSKKVI